MRTMNARMEQCRAWRHQMIAYIRDKEWEKLTPTPCPPDCPYCLTGKLPLEELICCVRLFTCEMEHAVEKMYGPMTPTGWLYVFLSACPSLPVLRYLFENGRLSPTQSDPYSLLNLFCIYYTQPVIEYLLSAGMDINLQNPKGFTPLLAYLHTVYNDADADGDGAADGTANGAADGTADGAADTREEEEERSWAVAHERIHYLLSHGADPLLANKEGVSPMSYVASLTRYPVSQKEALLRLLSCDA